MEECIFSLHYEANYKRNEQLPQNRDKKRIESIIKVRKIREDTLQKKLAPLMEHDSKLKVKYHLSCALALINIVPLNPLFKISQRRKKDVNLMKQNLIHRRNVCTVPQNVK